MKPERFPEIVPVTVSPPARGRGLKHKIAPQPPRMALSPPARGRGLKPNKYLPRVQLQKSPPARGRGLKHCGGAGYDIVFGRPPHGGVD